MAPELDDTVATGYVSDAGLKCAGCGAVGQDTPTTPVWAGVGHQDPDGPGGEAERFVAFPVCNACHQDPAHRKDRTLKMHFFPWAQRRQKVFAARMQVMSE